MSVRNRPRTLLSTTAMLAALSLLGACSDDDSTTKDRNIDASQLPATGSTGADGGLSTGTGTNIDGGAAPTTPQPTSPAPTGPAEAKLYAVPSEVYGADFATSTSYVPIV